MSAPFARPVLVVGSLNIDLVIRSESWPRPGETRIGDSLELLPGGKGANQAAAAARLGAATSLVGCVGSDPFASTLLDSLARAGVDRRWVETVAGSTGAALVLVDRHGENRIVVIPGANACVQVETVERALGRIHRPVVLLQCEIPWQVVEAAGKRAHASGATVLLNAAPAVSLPDSAAGWVDHLVVNETEAAAILGRPLRERGVEKDLHELRRRGFARVTLTRGSRGATMLGETLHDLRAPEVVVVDTTAAGDAFMGALACAAAGDLAPPEALRQAVGAGSLAVTRPGAQPSLPGAEELSQLLALEW